MGVKDDPCVRETVCVAGAGGSILCLTTNTHSQTCTSYILYTELAWKDFSLGLGQELWARHLLLVCTIVTASMN